MTEDERTALVDELARTLYRTNPKMLGMEHSAIVSAPYEEGGGYAFGARCQAGDIMPIIDRLLSAHDLDAVRLRAQVKYLRDYTISLRTAVGGGDGERPTREQVGYIIGGIDGNIAVAGDRAVAQAQGRGEGDV